MNGSIKIPTSIKELKPGVLIDFYGAKYKVLSNSKMIELVRTEPVYSVDCERIDSDFIKGMNEELSSIKNFQGFEHKKFNVIKVQKAGFKAGLK